MYIVKHRRTRHDRFMPLRFNEDKTCTYVFSYESATKFETIKKAKNAIRDCGYRNSFKISIEKYN